jgi:hypothetical protein
MNKHICVLLLILPFALHAQTDDDLWKHPLSAQSRPQFNRIFEAMARQKIIKGVFVQVNTLTRLDRSLISRGIFAVDADRGIIWDTRTPFPSVTAAGRDFVVQSSNGRTTRLDASGNEIFIRISQTMSAVFTGDAKTLTDIFELYFTETGGTWNLGLIPRDSAVKSFAKAIIMQGDSVLHQVVFYQQNGDTIRYELSGHYYPAELNADEKAFFPH